MRGISSKPAFRCFLSWFYIHLLVFNACQSSSETLRLSPWCTLHYAFSFWIILLLSHRAHLNHAFATFEFRFVLGNFVTAFIANSYREYLAFPIWFTVFPIRHVTFTDGFVIEYLTFYCLVLNQQLNLQWFVSLLHHLKIITKTLSCTHLVFAETSFELKMQFHVSVVLL